MLVRLTIANFLSFRQPVEFTMLATRERRHEGRLFFHESTGTRVVPIAALFGENASGKSNFYRAINFIRKLVLRPAQGPEEQVLAEPFRLDDGLSASVPSEFVIEILPKDIVYRLKISLRSGGVAEEVLDEIRGERVIPVYSRRSSGRDGVMQWNVEPLQRRCASLQDREFIGFKTRDTLPNQLFLGALRGKNIPVVDEIALWFTEQLALMLPTSTFKLLEFSLPTSGGLLEFCNEALRAANTGIFEIYPQSVEWQDFPASDELKEEIKKKLGERQITFVLWPDGRRFSIMRRGGILHVARLLTHHKTQSGRLERFELGNESEGTQRFIDLLPAFFELVSPGRAKVFVIDELDRSLHSLLARHLIKSYLGALSPNTRSQLIFTTHDVTLLDQEIMRRDEIWFVEKNELGSSALQPLSRVEGLRYDKDIRKAYLAGEFGGIPRFNRSIFRAS